MNSKPKNHRGNSNLYHRSLINNQTTLQRHWTKRHSLWSPTCKSKFFKKNITQKLTLKKDKIELTQTKNLIG